MSPDAERRRSRHLRRQAGRVAFSACLAGQGDLIGRWLALLPGSASLDAVRLDRGLGPLTLGQSRIAVQALLGPAKHAAAGMNVYQSGVAAGLRKAIPVSLSVGYDRDGRVQTLASNLIALTLDGHQIASTAVRGDGLAGLLKSWTQIRCGRTPPSPTTPPATASRRRSSESTPDHPTVVISTVARKACASGSPPSGASRSTLPGRPPDATRQRLGLPRARGSGRRSSPFRGRLISESSRRGGAPFRNRVARSAEQLGIVGAEDRRVVAGSGLVERVYESPDLRRHHKQVPSRDPGRCVAIRVRGPLRRQDRLVRAGLAHLVADLEPQPALEHVPGFIVGMMDVQRRDPLVT